MEALAECSSQAVTCHGMTCHAWLAAHTRKLLLMSLRSVLRCLRRCFHGERCQPGHTQDIRELLETRPRKWPLLLLGGFGSGFQKRTGSRETRPLRWVSGNSWRGLLKSGSPIAAFRIQAWSKQGCVSPGGGPKGQRQARSSSSAHTSSARSTILM